MLGTIILGFIIATFVFAIVVIMASGLFEVIIRIAKAGRESQVERIVVYAATLYIVITLVVLI